MSAIYMTHVTAPVWELEVGVEADVEVSPRPNSRKEELQVSGYGTNLPISSRITLMSVSSEAALAMLINNPHEPPIENCTSLEVDVFPRFKMAVKRKDFSFAIMLLEVGQSQSAGFGLVASRPTRIRGSFSALQ